MRRHVTNPSIPPNPHGPQFCNSNVMRRDKSHSKHALHLSNHFIDGDANVLTMTSSNDSCDDGYEKKRTMMVASSSFFFSFLESLLY